MNKLIIAVLLCLCSVAQGKTFDWKARGVNPYMGDIPSAVDDYKAEFTPAEREELKRRMRMLDYDEVVVINKYGIEGNGKKRVYGTAITKMHSGHKGVADPTRDSWTDADAERGLVYCVSGNERCVLVPTVCRNVALIVGTVPSAPPPTPPVTPPPQEPVPPPIPATPVAEVPPACACFAQPAPYISDDWGMAYGGGGGYIGGGFGGGGGGGGGYGGGGHEGHGHSPPHERGPHHGNWDYPPPPDDCPPYTPPPVTAVPEPQEWALLLAGLAFIIWKRNDRRKHKHL